MKKTMPNKLTDKQVGDTIDTLWKRHDGEAWLEELVDRGEGGACLLRMAEEILTQGNADTMLANLRAGVPFHA